MPSFLLVVCCVLALSAMAFPASAASERVEVLAVTASSTDGMLMDAVDDDASTAWQNKQEGEREAWLAVRFEAPSLLRGVRLDTGAMPSEVSFDVESSLDGGSYQPLLRHQRIASEQPALLLFPKPAQALYLRIRFQYSGTGKAPRYRIRELEALK